MTNDQLTDPGLPELVMTLCLWPSLFGFSAVIPAEAGIQGAKLSLQSSAELN